MLYAHSNFVKSLMYWAQIMFSWLAYFIKSVQYKVKRDPIQFATYSANFDFHDVSTHGKLYYFSYHSMSTMGSSAFGIIQC